ncbi:MAG: hypothetical protein ACJAQZ_003134 [Planctomycetota bacterium]|jgi:hypothetical protein
MTTDRNTVLAPADTSYVLPAPPRGYDLLVTDGGKPSPLLSAGAIASALGQRFQSQAQSMDLLLIEVRGRLEQLDGAIAEDSRAQLKGAVRDVVRVVDWCDALRKELDAESSKAVEGLEPIDLVDLCEQQANALQGLTDPIAVLSSKQVVYWGDRNKLAFLMQKALKLVWARTGGQGLRCIEVSSEEGVPSIRVCSRGEPAREIDPDVVDAFREAVDYVGAAVVPDELGPGGAGLMLCLPS